MSKMDYKSELEKMLDEEIKYGSVPFNSLTIISKKIYTQLKLHKYMSEMDVSHSLLGIIANCVNELAKRENKKINKKLRDIFDDESKIRMLNNQIRDYFKAIPKNYSMVLNLKNVIHTEEKEIIVNNMMTLKFEPRYESMITSLLKKNEPKIYSLVVYVNHKGYLDTTNFDDPHSKIKQFIYLAIALQIFGINPSLSRPTQINHGLLTLPTFQNYFIETESPEKKIILSFSANELDFFDKIEWCSIISPEKISESLEQLKNIFIILNNTQDLYKSKIKSALEWCFESRITQNETFQFILKFIALEALLGDQSGGEITKKLSNRCAFLLGRNHAEREKLLKELPELYSIRSKLVHGNKATLEHKDKDTLSYLDAILQCALFKELSMLAQK